MNNHPHPALKELYPNLQEMELAEVESNLDLLLLLMLRIHERAKADPLTHRDSTLRSVQPQSEA